MDATIAMLFRNRPSRQSWVLLLPLLLLGLGVRVTERGENEVEAGFKRAQEAWRSEDYEGAIQQYRSLYHEYPKSRYTPAALWETASIYYTHHYDLERATHHLGKLIAGYPRSPQAKDALLRLAEIHEAEDRDLDLAIAYWERALERNLSPQERRHVAFKVGDTHLKQRRLEEARRYLQKAVAEKVDDRLAQQALIRLGTIAQIESDHQAAIDFFEAVMAHNECQQCRAQAQLGLVESEECTGKLTKAAAIAEAIPSEQYPEAAFLLDRVGLEQDQ